MLLLCFVLIGFHVYNCRASESTSCQRGGAAVSAAAAMMIEGERVVGVFVRGNVRVCVCACVCVCVCMDQVFLRG